MKKEMVEAIRSEIRNFNPPVRDEIDTIYFGGGTPSLLNEQELMELFFELRAKFTVSEYAEITLEANPDDINSSALSIWKDAGINRLSVGIQSFAESELKWMNRVHSSDQSIHALESIRSASFKNFSADLIYGSPLLSDQDLLQSLSILQQFETPHISAYALTVEPKTLLDDKIRKNQSLPVDPDKQAKQYELLVEWLGSNGFENYEISNFAKQGYRSRHNTSYWLGLPYYGFGPSAHSFDGIKTRKWNIANNSLYIKGILNGMPSFDEETLTPTQQINEYIMISLRTIEGISLGTVREKFGQEELDRILQVSAKFIREGLLEINDYAIYLSKHGKFLADGIAADLFK